MFRCPPPPPGTEQRMTTALGGSALQSTWHDEPSSGGRNTRILHLAGSSGHLGTQSFGGTARLGDRSRYECRAEGVDRLGHTSAVAQRLPLLRRVSKPWIVPKPGAGGGTRSTGLTHPGLPGGSGSPLWPNQVPPVGIAGIPLFPFMSPNGPRWTPTSGPGQHARRRGGESKVPAGPDAEGFGVVGHAWECQAGIRPGGTGAGNPFDWREIGLLPAERLFRCESGISRAGRCLVIGH